MQKTRLVLLFSVFVSLHLPANQSQISMSQTEQAQTGQTSAGESHKEWYSHSFEVMGTQAKVEFEANNKSLADQLIGQVVEEMNRIDRGMSPYKPESELNLINQKASRAPLVISEEMFKLLQRSLYFSRLTKGAFDISFSSVGYLYDYRRKIRPQAAQIEKLTPAIDYRKIKLDSNSLSVFFSDPRVKIDLGGIAKGYAVDRCIQLLQKAGINNAYVNAGGDSRLIGKKQDRLWYIGIRHPRDENKLLANLPLEEIALSTSGDYERFFIEDGVRYHHIIDPKTGQSVDSIQSATILASDSTSADALSTSLFVMGVEQGMSLVNSLEGVSAIIVDHHGKLFVSEDLASAN